MKIEIPNTGFIGNIENFLRKIDLNDNTSLNVSFNEKWISVHPVVLSTVAAMCCYYKSLGVKIETETIKAVSGHYLQRMGLLNYIDSKQIFSVIEHDPSGRFIPITQIKTSDQLSEFIKDMIPLLHATPEQTDPIKYVMSELVRNVLEHSHSQNGAYICAQYLKKSNRVAVGVADTGIGIKGSMDFNWKTNTHSEAIKLAIQPGITGTTNQRGGTEQNAGAGLFFTKSIAKVSGDYFMIYSGDTLYKLYPTKFDPQLKLFPEPLNDKSSIKSGFANWKGTCVGIDFSLDINHEFSSLLDLIRNAYFVHISEKKSLKYKKPIFI